MREVGSDAAGETSGDGEQELAGGRQLTVCQRRGDAADPAGDPRDTNRAGDAAQEARRHPTRTEKHRAASRTVDGAIGERTAGGGPVPRLPVPADQLNALGNGVDTTVDHGTE